MRSISVLSTCAALFGAATSLAADVVSGTATYRERIALPPGAVFEARLLDVSVQDVAATELGSSRNDAPGAPPFAFEIPFDRAQIIATHTYAVRAEVRAGEQLLFTTDAMVPVLTRGAPDRAEIMMVQATVQSDLPRVRPAHGLALPATFTGDLPCADCAAIRHHLDLWEDQVFHLRREWIGGPQPLVEDTFGRWHVDAARGAIVLNSGAPDPVVFEIKGDQTLRLLDRAGQPIVSDLPYDLVSAGGLNPVDLSAPMIGEFVYFADSASFTECTTGRRYPVSSEADYLALERAYLEARAEPMAPLVVTLDGTIADRDGMEGGAQRTLIVDRLSNTWPGLTCERARAHATLENTYWRIDRLDGVALVPEPGSREPHVLLRSSEQAFSATVGCNQILGGFKVEADRLNFAPGPMTLMACPPPLDQYEMQLVDLLGRVQTARIVGPTLEVFDADGKALAQFEAVYLR